MKRTYRIHIALLLPLWLLSVVCSVPAAAYAKAHETAKGEKQESLRPHVDIVAHSATATNLAAPDFYFPQATFPSFYFSSLLARPVAGVSVQRNACPLRQWLVLTCLRTEISPQGP